MKKEAQSRAVPGSLSRESRASLGFLLGEASFRYLQRLEKRVGTLGLTLRQCRVLVHVSEHQGINQSQLAAAMNIDPMTLIRLLDPMQTAGWLERSKEPTDRRIRRLRLEPEAVPLLAEVCLMIERTCSEAIAGIADDQCVALTNLLVAIRENLGLPPAQLSVQSSVDRQDMGS
jgi:MarR family transcriptional regulator for hemolysin